MKSNDDDIHLSHAYDLLTQVTEKQSQPEDECSFFAEHMAAKMRKLDPIPRAYAEQQIYNKQIFSHRKSNNENISCNNMIPLPMPMSANISSFASNGT